jgi:hypothetical protein
MRCKNPDVSTIFQPSDFSLSAALLVMSIRPSCAHSHVRQVISSGAGLL